MQLPAKCGLQPMQLPAKKRGFQAGFQQCDISRIGLHEKMNVRKDRQKVVRWLHDQNQKFPGLPYFFNHSASLKPGRSRVTGKTVLPITELDTSVVLAQSPVKTVFISFQKKGTFVSN